MIECIEDLRAGLRGAYDKIHIRTNNYKLGTYDLETVLNDGLVTSAHTNPVDLVQIRGEEPLRIQMDDISGIASSTLGYHIAHEMEWKEDGWRQILVIPAAEFDVFDDDYKPNEDIAALISIISEDYLGSEIAAGIIDEAFFKTTLFIITGYNTPSKGVFKKENFLANLEALENLESNILVISDLNRRPDQLKDRGYTQHTLGLEAPKGIISFDNDEEVEVSGLEVLQIEKEAREFAFNRISQNGSIIDNATNPVLDMSSGRMALRGREIKAVHSIKFLVEFDDLMRQLYDLYYGEGEMDNVTNKFLAPAPKTAVEWFSMAATEPAESKICTYNIADRLITRNLKDNYISYVGEVGTVRDLIIGKIVSTIQEEYPKLANTKIPQEKWLGVLTKEVAKILSKESYIDVMQSGRTKLPGGKLKTASIEAPDILPAGVASQDPSYRLLDSNIKKYMAEHDIDLSKVLRAILTDNVPTELLIPDELFILAACFFIAEVNRNPTTFLTSLMLLDLAEDDPSIWNYAISQESEMDLSYNPFGIIERIYGDLRGAHPMTHDGSYFQSNTGSETPIEKRSGNLLNLVEYKAASIMLEWLELSCDVSPMEHGFIEYYKAEIFPRFIGRICKTQMIDEQIDILYVREEPKEYFCDLLGYEDEDYDWW